MELIRQRIRAAATQNLGDRFIKIAPLPRFVFIIARCPAAVKSRLSGLGLPANRDRSRSGGFFHDFG
jgi:hypothetical protein